MPVGIPEAALPITAPLVQRLWEEVRSLRQYPDDTVTIRLVNEVESQRLNTTYRGQKSPTNVLTFSYDNGEHDIALCFEIAKQEAKQRNASLVDYLALLITHALLHATGLDHERSDADAVATTTAEKKVLQAAGFKPLQL